MTIVREIKLTLMLFTCCTLTPTNTQAQRPLNFGLHEAQPVYTLPKSRGAIQQPSPKAKQSIKTEPARLTDHEYLLNQGWELGSAEQVIASPNSIFSPDFDTRQWHNATVPGTVLTTLVDQGIYPDPYWGINNLSIPDSLCRTEWWYRLAFETPKLNSKRATLLFEGINYKAEVWLNGKILGKINGAFCRGEFDATDLLNKNGKNVLAVRIIPPHNPGIGHEASLSAGHGRNGGQLCLDGPTFICSEGWDWMPAIRDRNIGIWQDVKLRLSDDIRLGDIQIITDLPLPDTTYTDITIKAKVSNLSNQHKTGFITAKMEGMNFSYPIELAPNESKQVVITPANEKALRYRSPKLWWPNGYGEQNLYTMELAVGEQSKESDMRKVRFGVRELDFELSVDTPEKSGARINFNPIKAYGKGKEVIDNLKMREVERLVCIPTIPGGLSHEGITELIDSPTAPFMIVKVNGEPIMCKGGNWGMDDAMKRVSKERMEPYFKLQRDQNFNMARNWTGESTNESFYELCDEYGILVFNDFWLSTEGWNLPVNDNDLFMANAADVVKRFVNHPSIAIWCPRNEGFAPEALERRLSKLIASEDGTRHYLPGSTKLNTTNSGPWDYRNPAELFGAISHGFDTEAGSPSLPTAESVRKMMAPEDLWPISDVWSYHDWHMGQWGDAPFMASYKKAIDTMFGTSENIDDFCKKAQLVNFESYRAIFEAWNSKMWNDCSGVLLWMSHPAWPSMVWQTYSWDYETPGAYFGSKKGCEPIHIQMNLTNGQVDLINASPKKYNKLTASALIYDINGKLLHKKQVSTDAKANAMANLFTLTFNDSQPEVVLVKLVLTDSKKRVVSDNFYWHYTKQGARDFTCFNELPQAKISAKCSSLVIQDNVARGKITLTNNGGSVALTIKLNLRNAENRAAVLPTIFSDGYFSIMPGETKVVEYECNAEQLSKQMCISAEGYNIDQISFNINSK